MAVSYAKLHSMKDMESCLIENKEREFHLCFAAT